MNSKGHLFISLAKSSIRIIGCTIAIVMSSIPILAISLGIAEILGITEELVDKR